jgi:hypothetical protein
VLYVILDISPFVQMISGLLMYWNRSLVKKWRRLRAQGAAPAPGLAGDVMSGPHPSRLPGR